MITSDFGGRNISAVREARSRNAEARRREIRRLAAEGVDSHEIGRRLLLSRSVVLRALQKKKENK